MFKNLFQKAKKRETTTDVVFKKAVSHVPWEIGTQKRKQSINSWDEIEGCILGIFADPDEFATLTAGDAPYHIRYVQATQSKEGIEVELGIEEGEKTKLVGKTCSKKECMDIFKEFYNTLNVRDRGKFKPVEFFV